MLRQTDASDALHYHQILEITGMDSLKIIGAGFIGLRKKVRKQLTNQYRKANNLYFLFYI